MLTPHSQELLPPFLGASRARKCSDRASRPEDTVQGKVGMSHRVKYQDFVNICILNNELLSDSFLPYPFPLPEFWQPGRKLGMSSLETWPKRKDSQMLSVEVCQLKGRLIADILC